MYFDKILASFQRPDPVAYTPQFRVEPCKHGFDLYDGSHHIGLLNTKGGYFLDLWSFSPFEAPVFANQHPNDYVRDMHTLRNSYINFPWPYGKQMFAGMPDPASCLETTWPSRTDETLHARIEATFLEGQRLRYEVRLVYDADWGRYRCYIDVDCWKLRPEGFEPLNMMMVGALHSKAEGRRWDYSVWEDPRHKLSRIVHSNVLFCATDFGRDPDGAWRTKYAPTTGAWIAYTTNPTCNPAMLVHECNTPLLFATCSQLFDEHLIWGQAGIDTLEEGYFHFKMHTEFVNLDAGLAAELEAAAADPPKPTTWRWSKVALPFHMDRVNSLEHAADPWEPEDCPILIVSGNPADPVSWATGVSHSGSHSLKLQSTGEHGFTETYPAGAVCNVDADSRYRFSAWVKTEGVFRFARLKLCTYEYTYNNQLDVALSDKLSGDSDWTYITVELDSDVGGYMMPMFQLYGEGRAWFDDPMFVKL